jgi:ubiquinone/menaquinone biosynthesis C-methylase UbiE
LEDAEMDHNPVKTPDLQELPPDPGNLRIIMEQSSNISGGSGCSLFEFMAYTIGMTVLHPGGYDATRKICSMCNINENSTVLDLACGAGTTSLYLSEKYGCKVQGIDISERLIADANTRLAESKNPDRIRFDIGDARSLPYPDNTFDVVIAQAFFVLIDDKEKALTEIYRVLKPGGSFGSLELSWFETPPREAYEEIRNKTCSSLVPRIKTFEDWEEFFRSGNFTHVKTIKNPMSAGMIGMMKSEKLTNLLRILFKMTRTDTRKRMMEVMKIFFTFDRYFGYGLFILRKPTQ